MCSLHRCHKGAAALRAAQSSREELKTDVEELKKKISGAVEES